MQEQPTPVRIEPEVPTAGPEVPTAEPEVPTVEPGASDARTTEQKTAEPEGPTDEPEVMAAEAEVASAESAAIVPIPGSHRQEKPSFWRRISLRGRSLSTATRDDRMIARLDAIESRLETSEQDLGNRIQQLDERFTEVWEVEEQLSRLMELHDILADVQGRQERIDGKLRGVSRRLTLISLLAGLAAAAGLAAIAVSL